MPFLPIAFYSNYYLVEINFQEFFSSLGITYSGPSGTARFIAKKFEISHINEAGKKTLIQGKPGTMVQDVKTPIFEYLIEAPIIINTFGAGQSNFLTHNSLNYFALKLANWQWQQLHGYSSTSVSASSLYAVLEEFSISTTEAETNQTLRLKSNILLGDNNLGGLQIEAFTIAQLAVQDPVGYSEVVAFIGRVARNYDMFTDMYFPNTGYYLTTGTPNYPNNIFLKSSDFEIKFDVESKYFLNTGNVVNFLVKNYDLTQKFGIVGTEQALWVDNFSPGDFYETRGEIALFLASDLMYKYQVPLIVKTKKQALNSDQLVSSDFEFSLYGSNYGPGNSPYGTYDLFQSDIA